MWIINEVLLPLLYEYIKAFIVPIGLFLRHACGLTNLADCSNPFILTVLLWKFLNHLFAQYGLLFLNNLPVVWGSTNASTHKAHCENVYE
jgi:hypothetical protein